MIKAARVNNNIKVMEYLRTKKKRKFPYKVKKLMWK